MTADQDFAAFDGPYEPSPWGPIAEEVERYEDSGGAASSELVGDEWIVCGRSGPNPATCERRPLVRVADGEGRYAVIGSMGGAPNNPQWVHNVRSQPLARSRMARRLQDYRVRGSRRVTKRRPGGAELRRCGPTTTSTRRQPAREIPVFVLERPQA
jgi:hypothetical protein